MERPAAKRSGGREGPGWSHWAFIKLGLLVFIGTSAFAFCSGHGEGSFPELENASQPLTPNPVKFWGSTSQWLYSVSGEGLPSSRRM